MAKKAKQVVKLPSKGKITWVLESSGLSGGVRVIYEEAKRLATKGWDVGFVSLEDRPKWFSVGALEWKKFAEYNSMANYIKQSPVEEKFISTWWKTAMVLGKVPRENNYYLVQDDEAYYYTSVAMKEHVRDTYVLPLKKFTTSHWVENNIFDVEYVGIGVDVSEHIKYHNKPKKRQAMLIGRRQLIKGASYQMEVAQRLSRELSLPIQAAAVDGGYQLSGNVTLNMGLNDKAMTKLFGESMYFLTNSQHEGFCIPNLEAMAAGCLVVTTDNDGCRDYAVNGENCLVVSRDDPREMVAAVKELETNKELSTKLRAGGLKTAREWNWTPVIDRLDSYFTRV